MNKLLDKALGLLFICLQFIVFLYVLLITADIPVNISEREFIFAIAFLLIYLLIFIIYSLKTKSDISIFLILPLGLWLMSLIDSLLYNYHTFDTIINIVGFLVTLICVVIVLYKRYSKKNK